MEEVRIRITMQKPYGPCGDTWFPDVIVFDTDEGMQTLYDRMKTTALHPLTVPLRTAMSEDEMLRRAREAVASVYGNEGTKENYRSGRADKGSSVAIALAALRNLDKPLPEPIDPLVLKAREILAKHLPAHRDGLECGKLDDKPAVLAVLEALRCD